MLTLIIAYSIFAFILGIAGRKKKIEGSKASLVNLYLKPINDFIRFLKSRKKAYKSLLYKCKRCGFLYTEKQHTCPMCEKEGATILLNKIVFVKSHSKI